jgi:hypothetical protein
MLHLIPSGLVWGAETLLGFKVANLHSGGKTEAGRGRRTHRRRGIRGVARTRQELLLECGSGIQAPTTSPSRIWSVRDGGPAQVRRGGLVLQL